MTITIANLGPLAVASLNVVGAAVKIRLAGGSSLTEQEMKRASGASYHLWSAKGAEIKALVDEMEAAEASLSR